VEDLKTSQVYKRIKNAVIKICVQIRRIKIPPNQISKYSIVKKIPSDYIVNNSVRPWWSWKVKDKNENQKWQRK
jgi:hypothetical protein